MTAKYTHGGYDAKDAYQWTPETRQELGAIIYRLYSEKAEDKKEAWVRFYRMKRYFMVKDWDAEIEKLDTYRNEKGAFSIRERMDQISIELVKHGHAVDDITTIQTKQKGAQSMSAINKIAEGLKLLGEGLISLSQEMLGAPPVKVNLTEANVKEPEPVKEEVKPEKKETKSAKTEKPVEKKEEKKAEIGRDEVKLAFIKFAKDNRDGAIQLLAQFTAKKFTEIADDDLESFNAKLQERVNNG